MKKLSLEELKNTCVRSDNPEVVNLFIDSVRQYQTIKESDLNAILSLARKLNRSFLAFGENFFAPIYNSGDLRVLTKADFEEKLPFANTKWDVREWTKEQKENWQRLMFEGGYSWAGNRKIVTNLDEWFYFINDLGYIGYSNKDTFFFGDQRKQMHYSDAFPEIKKYKYVPIEKSIFDLKERFENGDLFYSPDNGVYLPFTKEQYLAAAIANKKQVYERVEYKWNESDEVKDLIKDLCERVMACQSSEDIKWLVEFRENDFLEFCEKIVKLAKGE